MASPELCLQLRKLVPEEAHDQLLSGGESGLSDATLKRWLVARKLCVKAAAAGLTAHAAWRAAWVPKGRILEEEVTDELLQDKMFLQGQDQHGRGVCVLQARKHTMTRNTTQQRFITYCIDGMIASCDAQRNPDRKIVAVFELQGLRMRNLDVVGLKNIFALLQNHYVEVLDQLYMVGAPAIFWGLWSVVSPFIDPVTREKVVFLDAGDTAPLIKELGPQVLPTHLGGTAALIPVQDAWQQLLQQRQSHQQQELAHAPPACTAAAAGGCWQGTDKQDVQGGTAGQLCTAASCGYQSADAAVLIQTP